MIKVIDMEMSLNKLVEELDVSIFYADSSSNFKELCEKYGDTPSINAIGKTLLKENIIIIDQSSKDLSKEITLLHELLHIINYRRGIKREFIQDCIYDEYYATRKSHEITSTYIYPVILHELPNLPLIHQDVLSMIGRNMAYKHLVGEEYYELDPFFDDLETEIQERYKNDSIIECIRE